MSLFYFLVLLFILFWTLLGVGIYFFKKKMEKRTNERRDRMTEEWIAKRKEWNEKVNIAKRHLKGDNWRDPNGKEEFVRELFGEKVPQYLWYEIPGGIKLSSQEINRIISQLWEEFPNFGDLEMHRTLRVRNADYFIPMLLDEFPLVQIGYINLGGFIDENEFPEGVVVFSVEGFYPKTKRSKDNSQIKVDESNPDDCLEGRAYYPEERPPLEE